MAPRLTKEDKAAQAFIDTVDQLTLDLDKVGETIAYIATAEILGRINRVVEVANDVRVRRWNEYLESNKERMTCKSCGTVSEGGSFCVNCGTRI